MIPKYTKKGIDAFVKDGVPVGGFLEAVLSNDLIEAFGRADENNREAMFDIVYYLYNEVPTECYGSLEKVNNWIEKKRKERGNG